MCNEPEDGNRAMQFAPSKKTSLQVPYAVQLVPLNPTQGFSVEMWGRCDGGDGHVRLGMKSGRYGGPCVMWCVATDLVMCIRVCAVCAVCPLETMHTGMDWGS